MTKRDVEGAGHGAFEEKEKKKPLSCCRRKPGGQAVSVAVSLCVGSIAQAGSLHCASCYRMERLPHEIAVNIASLLSVEDICRLSTVSKVCTMKASRFEQKSHRNNIVLMRMEIVSCWIVFCHQNIQIIYLGETFNEFICVIF